MTASGPSVSGCYYDETAGRRTRYFGMSSSVLPYMHGIRESAMIRRTNMVCQSMTSKLPQPSIERTETSSTNDTKIVYVVAEGWE